VQPCLLHCDFIALLSITVQNAFVAGFVFTQGRLAEVIVAGDLLAAKVAHEHTAPTANLVASVGFDERLPTFGTGPDLRCGDRLLNGGSPFGLNGIFGDLVATTRVMTQR
jgi:hypothetical protein